MVTAEFEAKIEDGKIDIPDEYRRAFAKQDNIKVILIQHSDHMPANEGDDFIQQLLDQPLAVADPVPAHREDLYDR